MTRIELYFTLIRGSSDSGKSVIKSRNIDCQDLFGVSRDCRSLYNAYLVVLLLI